MKFSKIISKREFMSRAGKTALGVAAAYAAFPANEADAGQGISDVDAGLIGREAGKYSDAGHGVAVVAFVGDDAVGRCT